MKKYLFLIILCCAAVQSLWSQDFQPVFRHYGVTEGLPSSEVYNAVQDEKGYLWFSTDRGISRFDGYTFKNYSIENGLPEVAVYRVYLDHQGRLWGTTSSNRLFYVENDSVVLYKYNHLLQSLTVDGDVPRSISLDSENTLHMGFLEKGYITITDAGKMDYQFKVSGQSFDAYIKKIGNEATIYQLYNQANRPNHIYGIFGKDTVEYIDRASTHKSPKVRQGICSKAGDLWVIVGSSCVSFQQSGEVLVQSYDDEPFCVAETDDFIWTGFRNDGAIAYQTDSFPKKEMQVLKGNSVTSVYQDHEGGYWFMTQNNGVYYTSSLDLRSPDFGTKKQDGVNGLATDGKEKTFVRMGIGYVYVYEKGKFTERISFPDSILFYRNDLFYDSIEKGLWLSSAYDAWFYHENGRLEQKPYGLFYKMTRDNRHKGLTFLGTSTLYQPEHMEGWGITLFRRCRALHQDQNGTFWIGSFEGLGKVVNDSFIDLTGTDSLLSVRVEDITSHKNTIFLATIGVGVLKLDGDQITQFTKETGLNSNIVNCLLWNENKLWVGTNNGLNCIDFSTTPHKISSFTIADGLIGDEINKLILSRDTLWVGTRRGLSVFPVKSFVKKMPNPIVQMELVQIGGLKQKIQREYALSSDQNNLLIRFSGISFVAAGKTEFRYRMGSSTDDWLYTTVPEVRFTGLAPGEYVFELQTRNKKGEWQIGTPTILFKIAPQFWKTTWFLILLNGAVLLLVLFFFRRRIRAVRRRNQEQEDLRNYKLQALSAQMNPHFLFNSMNAIQDVLLNRDKAEASKYLSRFSRLMRNVLDNSTKSSILLKDELDSLNLYLDLELLRFDNAFAYEIDVAADIDPEKVTLPSLLLQPFVENAIWHGLRMRKDPGGNVSIRLFKKGQLLHCEIEDNGIGSAAAKAFVKEDHTSHGSSITEKRLALLQGTLGTKHHLFVIDLQDVDGKPCGTRVEISVPLVEIER